jgi:hypothetical protein
MSMAGTSERHHWEEAVIVVNEREQWLLSMAGSSDCCQWQGTVGKQPYKHGQYKGSVNDTWIRFYI